MRIIDLPPHKRILNTSYTVDCFKISVDDCSHYFLSHFHADHYIGLTRKFPHEIYCSQTTSNLLILKYKVKTKPLEMYKIYKLNNEDTVMCIDANHCPGGVCFVFKIQGEFVLHTGDFRCSDVFFKTNDVFLKSCMPFKFRTVYLDNTYEGFRPFESQKESISRVIKVIINKLTLPCIFPLKYIFMFCTYSVGKEKIFLSAGEYFNKPIGVTKEKKKIYDCFDEYTKNRLNKEVVEMVREIREEIGEVKSRAYFKREEEGCEQEYSTPLSRVIEVDEDKVLRGGEDKVRGKDEDKMRGKGKVGYEGKGKVGCGGKDGDKVRGKGKDKSRGKIDYEDNCNKSKSITTPKSILKDITSHESTSQIKSSPSPPFLVISTFHLEKTKLNKLLLGRKADRVIVFCGTGWKDTIKYFDWTKEDGRVVKKGIEVYYIPYSEHSSSEELKKFKEAVEYERIINTVKNKPTWDEGEG